MKNSEFAFETNWPLGELQTLSHSSSVLIMEAMAPRSKPNNPRSKNGDYYFCLGVSQCLQANYQLVVGLGCLAFTSCPPFCVPIRDFVWPKVDEYILGSVLHISTPLVSLLKVKKKVLNSKSYSLKIYLKLPPWEGDLLLMKQQQHKVLFTHRCRRQNFHPSLLPQCRDYSLLQKIRTKVLPSATVGE